MATPNAVNQMFSYFAVIHAPRRQHPTTLYSLEALLIMAILALQVVTGNWPFQLNP